MDIDYLLWLQQIRESSPTFIKDFFTFLGSDGILVVFLILPCVFYWCLDKASGMLAFMSYGFGATLNCLIKCTVCCYRPWVRDPRIVPDSVAIKGATGYSFPSGHSQAAGSMLGSLGWKNRNRRWALVVCVLLSLLMAFSRNFLGVHTPQDVIVGLLEGYAFVFICEKLLTWIDESEGRDLVVLLVTIVIGVLFLAYATFKPYPMDYVDGVLLVDPAAMISDCYSTVGGLFGLVIGWYIERTYIDFSIEGTTRGEKVARLVMGLLIVLLLYLPIGHALTGLLGPNMGNLLRFILVFCAAVAGAPALFGVLGRFFHKSA